MPPESPNVAPQMPQPMPQQPNPQPTQNQNPELLSKKIRSAGSSTFALGILTFLLSLASTLGVKSLAEDKKAAVLIYLVLVALVSAYWIMWGRKIKNSTDPQGAIAAINGVIISSLGVFAITFVAFLLSDGGGGGLAGLLALVLALYLIVAKSKINKLSSSQ